VSEAVPLPWSEKYRPRRIDDVVGNPEAKKAFVAWLNKWLAGKPDKKAALLYGPPGSGKTSLVYAAANQLGLELIEANASDVRTSEALQRRILRAVTEASLVSARGKIILLDEIDGINPAKDKGGLQVVLDIINVTRHPVVLAANDPWDPRLRELRELCLLIEFRKLGIRDIVKVLGNICQLEKVECDYQVLRAIAVNSKGDLRAAINDLQSIAAGREKVTVADLEILGYREAQYSMFDIVRQVLTANPPERARSVLSIPSLDYELLIQWLNENIPYQYSPSLTAIADAYDALSRADVMLARMRRRQQWGLLTYALDLITVGVASARERPPFKFVKYNFPQKLRVLSASKNQREAGYRVARGIASACHISTSKALTEVVPYLKVMYDADPLTTERVLASLGISASTFEEAFSGGKPPARAAKRRAS